MFLTPFHLGYPQFVQCKKINEQFNESRVAGF